MERAARGPPVGRLVRACIWMLPGAARGLERQMHNPRMLERRALRWLKFEAGAIFQPQGRRVEARDQTASKDAACVGCRRRPPASAYPAGRNVEEGRVLVLPELCDRNQISLARGYVEDCICPDRVAVPFNQDPCRRTVVQRHPAIEHDVVVDIAAHARPGLGRTVRDRY